MNFESVQAFYQRLATDEIFRSQVLEEIASDPAIQSIDEDELTAILGGQIRLPQSHQIYGSPIPDPLDFPELPSPKFPLFGEL